MKVKTLPRMRRACCKICRFLGIGLIKLYLIGCIEPVFENRKKYHITPPETKKSPNWATISPNPESQLPHHWATAPTPTPPPLSHIFKLSHNFSTTQQERSPHWPNEWAIVLISSNDHKLCLHSIITQKEVFLVFIFNLKQTCWNLIVTHYLLYKWWYNVSL